jgi:hypothetical protein
MHPIIENIELFYKKGSSKCTNDAENKIREDILVFLQNELPPEYAIHEKWRNLFDRFHETLRTLCPVEYRHLSVIKKGGRTYNYDFEVIYFGSIPENAQTSSLTGEIGEEIHRINVEFKHNSNSINKIPQILSLQDRFGLMEALSYSEYYYTYYLDAYLAAIEYTGEKPSQTEYISLVSGISYEKHPMFIYMRSAENGPNKIKSANIVKESIHTYLHTYIEKFNVEKFTKKLLETQINKIFLLWDLTRFNVETMTDQGCKILHIQLKQPKTKKTNTIIALSVKYEYQLLLRWRNHNGVLNPAWQIKATKITNKSEI